MKKELWAEGINMVVYVLNRSSISRIVGKTSYQIWTNKDFVLNELKMTLGTGFCLHS